MAAVVYNPIKVELDKLREAVQSAEQDAGFQPTTWFASAEEDFGREATRAAIAAGAAVVLAAGGDGTVRAVAETLRGSGIPMAVLPSGTGNLLARNLDLSLQLEESIRIAFTGVERKIDLGIAEIVRENGDTEEHAFLVMAGIGLDAKMIAKTSSKLKKRVGWLAYIDGTMRALPEVRPLKLRYRINGGPTRPLTAHTMIIGNCGALPGGILLMPEAEPDDGILDIAALRPRGPFGWLRVWQKIGWENGVLRKSAAGRKIIGLTKDVRDVAYFRARTLELELDAAQEFQLDGDEFGKVASVVCAADPSALGVMVASLEDKAE